MLTPFTTNPQVRSVFGLSEEELTDETLDLPMYEANLRLELRTIGVGIIADYTTTEALPGPLTDVQKDFVDAVTLFAPYAVAHQLTGLPLFAVKSISDGKAGITRHSDAPFDKLIDTCKKNYERFRQVLENAYAAFKNADAPAEASIPTLFAISSPDSDPVVGT